MGFDIEEMKKRFQKYGTIYLNEDIIEDVSDIIGNEDIKELMEDFFLALKRYKDIAVNLKAAKLVPNFTMLLFGPPGTGKTSLTRAMAKKHNIPIGVVEADRLVSPLLGDTVKNIRSVFDLSVEFVKENGLFILFFDEIDAVTSERANAHEVGEIKRAVISFLQIIDKIANDAVPIAIFGATNHQNQLDSAVWRRFTYHLYFDFPNFIIRRNIIEAFIKRIENASIGIDNRLYNSLDAEMKALMVLYEQKKLKLGRDLSEDEFSEIFETNKTQGKAGLLYYTQGYTGADLGRASRVALFKALQKNFLTYDDYFHALSMVGGTKTHVIQAEELMQTRSNLSKPKSGNNNQKEDNKKPLSKLDIDL
jgi:SpoVK/Ycf46/Vps4 family AAA+-type ATPase